MILRFENSLEDMVAFNRYHCAHSPVIRKTKLTGTFFVSALLIIGSLFVPPTADFTRPNIIATAIGAAGLFSIVYSYYTFPRLMDRQARRLYKEGTNKGTFGQHELEIDDGGLVERTEVNETRHTWEGVERIAETDNHAFIYISSMMAHVIPKRSITSGDANAFIARAKQLWSAANPIAATEQEA